MCHGAVNQVVEKNRAFALKKRKRISFTLVPENTESRGSDPRTQLTPYFFSKMAGSPPREPSQTSIKSP